MHDRPKSTAAPFASTVVQRTRADGQLAERDVGIPHAGVPTRGLESRAFFVTVFSFYSTLVSILVVAAVVIGDAGRHRAAGRVVIGEVDRPLSSYFFSAVLAAFPNRNRNPFSRTTVFCRRPRAAEKIIANDG